MPSQNSKKQKCPKCNKYEGLELIYGTPTEQDAMRVKQGFAVPGGFMPKSGPAYTWNCGNCGHVWGKSKLDNKHCMISVIRSDFEYGKIFQVEFRSKNLTFR